MSKRFQWCVLVAILLCGRNHAWGQKCADINDPVALPPFNLVDAYCISSPDIGVIGGAAHVTGAGTFQANSSGVMDVFVLFDPKQLDVQSGQSVTYSSVAQWTTAAAAPRLREWVGNFSVSPPQAFLITDTNASIPPEGTLISTAATITDRSFTDAQFPPIPVTRYHLQIAGLAPNEAVTFSKSLVGGSVVPEPTSAVLVGLAAIPLLAHSRRVRRS